MAAEPVGSAHERLTEGLSLRARLLAVVSALLVLALLVTGAVTVTLLRSELVQRIDEQLTEVTQGENLEAVLRQLGGELPGRMRRDALPTPYVIQVTNANGTSSNPLYSSSVHKGAVPDLPAIDFAGARQRGGEVFTVGDDDGGTWRAVAVPARYQSVGGPPRELGVVVALPDDVDRTLRSVVARFLLLGLGVLATLVVVGYFAVGRAFRPLREVQAVATSFGGGDTSRRVRVTAPATEVGSLGTSVNGMLDQIETTLAAREASEARMRRFVGDASHELRTPLAAVRGFAELYRMGAVSTTDDVAHAFRRIEDESTRMGGLVEDLLVLARMDAQRPLQHQPLDLLVLAADAVHDARALAPDRVVTLRGLDGAGEAMPTPLTGDEPTLRQVVTNLMANAVRHTPAGSPVTLEVGRAAEDVVLRVIDHGPGVPSGQADQIFERFFRADASRSRGTGGGSGLGLAIVAAIVAAHDGSAQVLQTPGGGATFEVRLPAGGTDWRPDREGTQAAPSPDSEPVQRGVVH